MPAFRVYLDDPDAPTHVVQASDPEAARDEARRRFSLPIRKIKLDRGTVEPTNRAPRLTRRELKETARMSTIGEQLVQRAQALAAAKGKPLAARIQLTPPGPVTTPEAVARKMANDFLEIAAVNGSVEDADLYLRGWTPQAVIEHGPAARALANAASVRDV